MKEEFYQVQDAYLQEEIKEKCDAIVDVAKSQMTGCYIPHHCCISTGEFHFTRGLVIKIVKEFKKKKQV